MREIDGAALTGLDEVYGPDGTRELIAAYLQDAPTLIAALDQALAAGDLAAARAAAHKLKSTSALLGARELAASCERLEHSGNADATALAGEIRRRCTLAQQELRARL